MDTLFLFADPFERARPVFYYPKTKDHGTRKATREPHPGKDRQADGHPRKGRRGYKEARREVQEP